jgi:hypothetical protein
MLNDTPPRLTLALTLIALSIACLLYAVFRGLSS